MAAMSHTESKGEFRYRYTDFYIVERFVGLSDRYRERFKICWPSVCLCSCLLHILLHMTDGCVPQTGTAASK
jgi:hypothetical protein